MALLLQSRITSPSKSLLQSSLSPAFALSSLPLSRLCKIPSSAVYPKPPNGCRVHGPFFARQRQKNVLIVKVSSTSEGAGLDEPEPISDSEEEDVPIQNLPMESKLQLKLEQKMRMKMAKKIRLRRKKLVRKRRLRKKGRWHPSKLKKNNKNV